MPSDQQKYDKLTEQLSEMPQVKDQREKEEIRQQIYAKIHQNKTHFKPPKRKRWIPITSTVLAVSVLIFLSFLFSNGNFLQNNLMESSQQQDTATYTAENEAFHEESSTAEGEMNTEQGSMAGNAGMFVQHTDDHSTIIHAVTSDPQLQYVIPVSFIVPAQETKEKYYNELESYMNKHVPVVPNYLFKGATFEIDEQNKQVNVALPDDFSLGGGSSVANMFEDQLSTMFTPYGLEKVVFTNPAGISLGQFGTIQELPLNKKNTAYKLYSNENVNMLVQVPLDEYTTIEQALTEMKSGDQSYHVFPTIPEEVEFSIVGQEEQLEITIENAFNFQDNRTATIMVESILMTANSFGYDTVKFSNVPDDNLGYYDLSEPLQVPDAVNPIMLQ
ncbi:hypothetical protein [Oceanobacillus kapialis]|uniref:hypothetical protein n=1 Tax=Oceanobacillus kapialis TaxID=481353 RepID=UPI00384B5B94